MLAVDFDWLSKKRGVSPTNWISLTLDLLNQENEESRNARESLACMLSSNEDSVVKYVVDLCMVKIKDGKKPEDNDRDVLYQVLKWVHKTSGKALEMSNSSMFGPLVELYVLKKNAQSNIVVPPKRNWIARTEFFELMIPLYEEVKLSQLLDSVLILANKKC